MCVKIRYFVLLLFFVRCHFTYMTTKELLNSLFYFELFKDVLPTLNNQQLALGSS